MNKKLLATILLAFLAGQAWLFYPTLGWQFPTAYTLGIMIGALVMSLIPEKIKDKK